MDYFTTADYSIENSGCHGTNSMRILPPSPDSGQNSLEYWDYAVELEMLNGNNKMEDDLELAANLGKALLLANRKLETEVKENQIIIDEQSQEIARILNSTLISSQNSVAITQPIESSYNIYLSKQTSALREANESRLKIYEQLEISIQDLEQTNQRFKAESSSDRKKIQLLLETIEQLETKCEVLHKDLDSSADQRGRPRTKSHHKDARHRRSISCENSLQIQELSYKEDLHSRFEEMEVKLKDCQSQRLMEVRKRDDLEIELCCSTQENQLLREQLVVFKEREEILKSIEEDLSSIDETSSGFCRKCNNLLETASNHTMQGMDEIEVDDMDNIRGPCSLFRLRNGGFAYGSQESLGSLGRLLTSEESSPTSIAPTESQPNSLYSELNVEYWSAMNKCEKLIKQREGQGSPIEVESNLESCNRCPTCTCEFKPKHILEEFSEVESASSGFSESINKLASKSTQTEESSDDITPTVSYKPIVVTADSTSIQALPEYRKILHEVYYNIKQIVDHDKLSGFKPKTFEKEDTESMKNSLPTESEDMKEISPEISTTAYQAQDKPQRPDFLEIYQKSIGRQKRRRRSKKSLTDVKGEEKICNETKSQPVSLSSIQHTNNELTEIPSLNIIESPKSSCSTRRDKPRRGCPHKIRNKNKIKTQNSDKRQVDASAETFKIAHPSVEVAKLRKLEMTYAEALKNPNVNRRSNIRK